MTFTIDVDNVALQTADHNLQS